MIINKEEVEKAAENYCNIQNIHPSDITLSKEVFMAGALIVESKVQEYIGDIIIENQGLKLYKDNEAERFEELAVKFLNWYQKETTTLSGALKYWDNDLEDWVLKSNEEIFEAFLKKRKDI